ncbi:MAG TPA: hypothetical protein VHS09_17020 [Polyangiaceae bacterium]|jgi:hypothetical protein|nr:hypothetical protein [Polyangiaceae bacterium]
MSAASNLIRFPLGPTEDETTDAGAHRHVGPDFLAEPPQPSHFVQFYEDEDFL